MPSGTLTPAQLAARWRIAVGTLANWRRAGRGPKSVPLGDGPKPRRVYLLSDVLEYEERQKGKT